MKKFNVTVNGKAYSVEVEEVGTGAFTYAPVQTAVPVQQPVQNTAPIQQVVEPVSQPAAPQKSSAPVSGEKITAPMPGTILDIKATEGQKVKAGDLVLILEAMKMENEIVAPKDGVIAAIHTSKGTSVSTGDALFTLG